MNKLLVLSAALVMSGFFSYAYAVPVLQIGAPAGTGDTGTYADYIFSLTSPTEEDTAITLRDTIYFAGVYADDVDHLGGFYTNDSVSGRDWSDFDSIPVVFDGHGAIVVASVPDGATGSLTLTVNNLVITAFYTSESEDFFPTEHAPLKDEVSDYLFFDIGVFSNNSNAVPNFDETETDLKNGEIIEASITVAGYDWIHFDLMALATDVEGNNVNQITSWDANPGSHDVTWKDGGGGGGGGGGPVPEPATMVLMGLGLIGLGFGIRKKVK